MNEAPQEFIDRHLANIQGLLSKARQTAKLQQFDLYADHATLAIIRTLQSIPGKSFLGELPIQHKEEEPAPTFLIYNRLRHAINKKIILDNSFK